MCDITHFLYTVIHPHTHIHMYSLNDPAGGGMCVCVCVRVCVCVCVCVTDCYQLYCIKWLQSHLLRTYGSKHRVAGLFVAFFCFCLFLTGFKLLHFFGVSTQDPHVSRSGEISQTDSFLAIV